MPDDVAAVYNEARGIAGLSPRAATALLRLAAETLIVSHLLDRPGTKLDVAIGELVRDGKLRDHISKAADLVRIGGNSAVHPGQIVGDDSLGTELSLFDLLNLIVREAIEEPQVIDAMFDRIPESKRDHIEDRNSR